MEKSIYTFIIKYSLRQQIILTVLSFASFVPYYYYLTMPKTIVNQGISGKDITFPYNLLGQELSQTTYLLMLTAAFLGLVIVQQCFKYSINVYQGISGERMLRRLRYELYAHVLRFPLPTFRKLSQGEIIPMIVAETESLGGFIAESFSTPLFQGGLFLVSLGFLFVQNWAIALAALALYPFQLYIIPKMQRKVNLLGKERVKAARRLSDRIGESIQGVQEVHAHNTARRLLSEFSQRLGDIYWTRFEIFQRKFMIKFLNNFLQQAGPFLFYSIGGYLAIRQQLDVGTIVAAVAAHKEMGAPLKELLNHYQQREDARIKYEQVIAQFDPDGMRDPRLQLAEPDKIEPLAGELQVSQLNLADEAGNALIENVSFQVPLESHVAVVGNAGSGREDLALLLARLLFPGKGKIAIGGNDIAQLPEAVTGRRIAYVGASPYIFNASIESNLFYGLRHLPLLPRQYQGEELKRHQTHLREAAASGNSTDDPAADWTDYAAAGVEDMAGLREAGIRALRIVQLHDDVYQFGLRGTINPNREPDLAEAILKARAAFRDKLARPEVSKLVEGWDRARYNRNATVAENLMFGNPVGDALVPERLAEHPYVLQVLDKVGLTDTFLKLGHQVAATTVELFADLPPDHEFFQQFSFISSEDLPLMQELLGRASKERLGELKAEDRARLMSLPFKLIPDRHRLVQFDEELMARIVQAREVFASDLPENLRHAVAFLDREKYSAVATIQDNILFGKVVYGQAQAAEMVSGLIGEVIDDLGLRNRVAMVGLNFECGIAGGRLTQAQRQKLAIARCIVKRPDLFILSDATLPLDSASQGKVFEAILEEFRSRGIVWSLQRAQLASRFDRILVMRSGRLVEQGGFDELDREGTHFRELLAQE
ncbi:MAG: ATP-binding cassette domain-containing protein [Alphaproteobacteria bacterium]|nr:ATP-binding cassette domain-containing protein [Alphaproteobacteria bacterium]